MIPRSTLRSAAVVLLSFSIIRCSSSADAPSTPVTPIVSPPKAPPATLVVSSDTMSATLISGAAAVTREFDITAGTTTAVVGLVASVEGATNGWVSATLSSETAPAKLTVTVKPAAMTPGAYDAVVRIGATGADARTIRASLVVKPRPRLALDKSAIAFAANLGDSVATQTVAIASVDGSIDSLSVAKPDCGSSAAWMTATLNTSKAPATLTLKATPGSLGAGSYSCTIGVSTSQVLVDSASQVIRVSLTLKAVPRLGVSIDTVRSGAQRTTDAPPTTVAITNTGTGTLAGLVVDSVLYSLGANGWLSTSLNSTTAPATLTLRPTARSLSAGTYFATVWIAAAVPGVAPKPVVVSFQVSPIPSVLYASPAHFTAVGNQTLGIIVLLTGSVTHTGDSPLTNVAFNAPAIVASVPFSFSWVTPLITCSGVFGGPTPCVTKISVIVPPLSPVGTYNYTIRYYAFDAKVTTSVQLILTILPGNSVRATSAHPTTPRSREFP